MHHKNIVTTGKKINEAEKALIMLHGRGSRAEDILSFSSYLNVKDFALVAPQADNHTWYPFSFLELPQKNEPWLSSAIKLLSGIVTDINNAGISTDKIYLTGFSQGACLALEFAARNAQKYGGIAAFTGGLIGDKIYRDNYSGDFQQTPVFIGTGSSDPHVPVTRVYATANIYKEMMADITEKVYERTGHTIIQDEIESANSIVFK